MLTDYTTYDEIRAILGISEDELEDSVLSLDVYSDFLDAQLESFDVTLAGQYQLAVAVAPVNRTMLQKQLYQRTRMFATYLVAIQLLDSVELFVPRKITDGKAAVERINDPFARLRAALTATLGVIRAGLLATLVQIDPEVAPGAPLGLIFAQVVGAPVNAVLGA